MGTARTKIAVATLAVERIERVASIKAKMVEPEKAGIILEGYQLKIKNPAEVPATKKASLALLS